MLRHKKMGISTMLAASIFATTLSPVSALAEEKMRSVRNPAKDGISKDRQEARDAKINNKPAYSDIDILKLLLFAKGKVAEDHPETAKALLNGRRPAAELPSDATFESMVTQLKTVDPEYHEKVTLGVQVNDPLKAEQAMKRLSDDLNEVYRLRDETVDEGGVTTWAWHDAHVVAEVEALAVMAAAVYEAAAVAHVAAVVIAIVPAAITYQFEMNEASSVDRRNKVSAVTKAFSQESR